MVLFHAYINVFQRVGILGTPWRHTLPTPGIPPMPGMVFPGILPPMPPMHGIIPGIPDGISTELLLWMGKSSC